MRVERVALEGDPGALAARVRALAPAPEDVEATVAEVLERVRTQGDEALLELTRRLDPAGHPPARVGGEELSAALAGMSAELRAGLELARANVEALAAAQLEPASREVVLDQGQRVTVHELAVGSVAVYVPGGRAPYPSTVVMGAVTALTAGVERVVVCSPSGDPAVLAACALCDVGEVHRMGGAQAIAALAYGTESVAPVDVIVGPGNAYVTEAKRQVFGQVGIDGLAGPSELVVVSTDAESASLVALDLAAQAEHGEGSLVAAISPSTAVIDALVDALPDGGEVPCVLIDAPDVEAALALADALAPEHLQLIGEQVERLAATRVAGCVFAGAASATAFGDYVAGSNHVLPTGGAARFASALGPRAFRRRMAEVRVGGAAAALAPAGAAIARVEGFEAHAESMEARMGDNPPAR